MISSPTKPQQRALTSTAKKETSLTSDGLILEEIASEWGVSNYAISLMATNALRKLSALTDNVSVEDMSYEETEELHSRLQSIMTRAAKLYAQVLSRAGTADNLVEAYYDEGLYDKRYRHDEKFVNSIERETLDRIAQYPKEVIAEIALEDMNSPGDNVLSTFQTLYASMVHFDFVQAEKQARKEKRIQQKQENALSI